jgi:hypothetical protein
LAARTAAPASREDASIPRACGAIPPVLAQPAMTSEIVRTASAAIPFCTGDCTISPSIGYETQVSLYSATEHE